MRSTAVSGTIVSASTKHNSCPELAATPALRAAADFRPTQGINRTPAASAKAATMPGVASSLPSSATMTSKDVSGSQRFFREMPEARATLARIASRTSPISASSFRAGITLEDPAGDQQRAAWQQHSLASRMNPQPSRYQLSLKIVGGKEAPGVQREL